MPATIGWHRPPDEKRRAAYDWPRRRVADDEVTLSGLRAARRRRRPRRRRRESVHRPRRHHGRERWPPADATDRRRRRAAPAHRVGAVGPHKPARRVHHSIVAPEPAAANSVHRHRDAPAEVRSDRHVASRHPAAHGQARQNPLARRVRALWRAYHRARHRNVQGFAPALERKSWTRSNRAHIASPPRISPTAMPSIASARALVSTMIGAKSGFSAISSITPSC